MLQQQALQQIKTMSKNITAIILIVLAIGIYFTFTKDKVAELDAIKTVNAEYRKAIDNAALLIQTRDKVMQDDINISEENNLRLEKILPDNVDNVRLIIDVKDNIAARHGLFLKGIKTTTPDTTGESGSRGVDPGLVPTSYGTVGLSFSVTTSYQTFISFLRDLEASLRVMDVERLSISTGTGAGTYDFSIDLNTYWLKQ